MDAAGARLPIRRGKALLDLIAPISHTIAALYLEAPALRHKRLSGDFRTGAYIVAMSKIYVPG
jgi:hypothetical protein